MKDRLSAEKPRDEGTNELGWAPVRQIPRVFARKVAQAEAAAIRWHHHAELASLDYRVANWEWICCHPQFARAPLTFRLDALNRCGIAHLDRGERLQGEGDLTRAEARWQEALALAPDKWPDTARYLHNLGILKQQRYRRTGDKAALTEAIDLLRQALEDATARDTNTALFHESLAMTLTSRYERQGTLDDLENAIVHREKALSQLPPGTPRRAMYLDHLGTCYRQRYLRSGSPDDIQQAVALIETAVQETHGERQLPSCLTNLANALLDRYRLSGSQEDLERAINAHQQAVGLTPDSDPMLASRLNNLGNSLSQRYDDSRAVYDLDRAIEAYQHAVQLTPLTDTDLPSRLYNLANNLRNRYLLSGDRNDFAQAVQCYRDACNFGHEYSLEWMLGAASVWGGWAEQRKEWDEAKEAYGYGLQAVERLYQTQLLSDSREPWLKEARDLAEHAAYVLARLGEFTEAVATLEHNRTRVLSEALTYHEAAMEAASSTDKNSLELARQRVADLEKEARASGEPGGRDLLAISADLRQAREDLTNIINRIGSYVSGFLSERLGYEDIASLAATLNQPLVYLLTTLHGSLALIVTPTSNAESLEAPAVHPVWLDGFQLNTLDKILYDQDDSPRYLHATVLGGIESLQGVLDCIWPLVSRQFMQPIAAHLNALGYQEAVLIPTGRLSLLPLHAVELEHVIFTYIPSACALRSVSLDRDSLDVLPSFLGIGSPSSRRQETLAFARFEVEDIATLFAQKDLKKATFYDAGARRSDIIGQIPGTTHLHFACHGRFDVGNPIESALYLAGDDILTLRALLEGDVDVSTARLAVLSACQTAITDFRNVPDEAVGFPAGFIQAGVPALISTLWPVNDVSTAVLLTQFYGYHLNDGMVPAAALNRAQQWLRCANAGLMNLADYYKRVYMASGRRDQDAYRAMRYFELNPDKIPFSHPYYWAAFVFSGIWIV